MGVMKAAAILERWQRQSPALGGKSVRLVFPGVGTANTDQLERRSRIIQITLRCLLQRQRVQETLAILAAISVPPQTLKGPPGPGIAELKDEQWDRNLGWRWGEAANSSGDLAPSDAHKTRGRDSP